MGWIKTTSRPHLYCLMPELDYYAADSTWIDSVWQCDKCGKQWKIVEWSTPGGINEYSPTWELLDTQLPW